MFLKHSAKKRSSETSEVPRALVALVASSALIEVVSSRVLVEVVPSRVVAGSVCSSKVILALSCSVRFD